jgi:hypothetical protein
VLTSGQWRSSRIMRKGIIIWAFSMSYTAKIFPVRWRNTIDIGTWVDETIEWSGS